MKTASKVFLIMGMVAYPFYALTLFLTKELTLEFLNQSDNFDVFCYYRDQFAKIMPIALSVIGGCFVVALAVGIISMIKLRFVKSKKELILFGILSAIFVNPVAGILMLCIPKEELQDKCCASMSEVAVPLAENPNQKQE